MSMDLNIKKINKTFNSIDYTHTIKIDILDDIAWFYPEIKYDNCKTFLLLIKDVIQFLNINNIKYIQQYICGEDLKYLINSTWIQLNDDVYLCSTKLEHFLSELINLTGIKKI